MRADATVPSMTRSKVEGIPRGLKLSAVGPILALGIQACTEHGGGVPPRQISSKCVIIAMAAGLGYIRHAAYGMPSGPGAESLELRMDLIKSSSHGGDNLGHA